MKSHGDPRARAGDSLPPLISALRDRACFDHPTDTIVVLQTHISYVLLTGTYAYKIKKPVSLPFLDFSTLECGLRLTQDDRLRRRVIADLICHGYADKGAVMDDFDDYFARELAQIEPMQADGLLRVDDDGIRVLAPGRLLIRNICMVFDRYLLDESRPERFSKAI